MDLRLVPRRASEPLDSLKVNKVGIALFRRHGTVRSYMALRGEALAGVSEDYLPGAVSRDSSGLRALPKR